MREKKECPVLAVDNHGTSRCIWGRGDVDRNEARALTLGVPCFACLNGSFCHVATPRSVVITFALRKAPLCPQTTFPRYHPPVLA